MSVGRRRLDGAGRRAEAAALPTPEPSGARLFDLGYRGYEGPRKRPAYAIVTLTLFTLRRVLGLGRGARHKILPAITLAIAYVPALGSVVFAAVANTVVADGLITYGDYTFFIGSALVLFSALIAPEALCPDRRSGMFGLYLAGPLDRTRYLAAKGIGVLTAMLLITVGPLLFMFAAFVIAGLGPPATDVPLLLLRIGASGLATAALYASLSLAVSSFTTRRAAAAVALVLVFAVPPIVVRSAIESADAPDALDLFSFPFVAGDLSRRIFGESPDEDTPITHLSSGAVAGALVAIVVAAALVCWLRYRRIESVR
jgi:ABC-2 type transport system permease protein